MKAIHTLSIQHRLAHFSTHTHENLNPVKGKVVGAIGIGATVASGIVKGTGLTVGLTT